MIDIESMDRDALIAEIRRLRAHRKCPICGSAPKMQSGVDDKGEFWWASCTNPHCYASGQALDSESAAWAAWDGVEG